MIFVLLLSAFFSTAHAGGVNGGGSDHLPADFGAAWFLDGVPERSIGVCFVHDPTTFPVAPEDVKAQFTAAMKTWEDYIVTRKIDVEADEEEDVDPIYLKLVTRFRFLTSCTNADLTVYLGVNTPEIEDIKKQMFDPIAFAHRQSYDEKMGWGKGIIWLKGMDSSGFIWNLNDHLNLRGILIHELGHVLGNEHMDGTIMDAAFAEKLFATEIPRDVFYWDIYKNDMTSIDSYNELVQLLSGIQTLPEGGMWMAGTKAEAEAFKFVMGRLPVGTVKTNLRFEATNRDENLNGVYELKDDQGSISLPLTTPTHTLNFTFGERNIFSRFLIRENQNLTHYIKHNADSKIISLTGSMILRGKPIALLFEGSSPIFEEAQYPEDRREDAMLMHTSPYRLIALEGSARHVLYAKNKWQELNGGDGRVRRQQLQKNYISR